MTNLLFQSKQNRDARYKELKAQGIIARRGTTGPQEIHPQYIEDYQGVLDASDTGIGNTIYKTLFSQLYKLEWEGK